MGAGGGVGVGVGLVEDDVNDVEDGVVMLELNTVEMPIQYTVSQMINNETVRMCLPSGVVL